MAKRTPRILQGFGGSKGIALPLSACDAGNTKGNREIFSDEAEAWV
jgi:hypothetical protein